MPEVEADSIWAVQFVVLEWDSPEVPDVMVARVPDAAAVHHEPKVRCGDVPVLDVDFAGAD